MERVRTAPAWACRSARRAAALAPGYVGIDERGAVEILAETVHFGRFVRFFGLDDSVEGDWEALLARDPTAILALVATVDVERRSAEVEAILRAAAAAGAPAERGQALRRLVSVLLGLAADIERWLGEAGGGLRGFAEDVAERLEPRLRTLIGLIAAAERAGLILDALPDSGRHSAARWLVEELAELEREAIEARLAGLGGEVRRLFDALRGMADAARQALEQSRGRSDHPPHLALVMTFAELFGTAQARLNALPSRVAGYYHRDLLGAEPRPSAADRMLLALAPAPGAPQTGPTEVPEGTLFPAGQDPAGAPILFTADEALAVTGARIAALRLWQPEPGRLGAHRLPLERDGAVGLNPFSPGPLPAAEIGLAVAGEVLALAASERRVTLRLRLEGQAPTEPPPLRVAVSTAEGWHDVPRFEWAIAGDELILSFALDAKAPALVASLELALPAVRLLLEPEAAALRLADARVEVAVKGAQGFTVDTAFGPAEGPGIAPFGPQPAPGAWLRIDHPVFHGAPPDRLALGLDWAAMPPGPDGFRGHYANYRVGPDRRVRRSSDTLFTNASFSVDLSAPVGGGTMAGVPLFGPGAVPDLFADPFYASDAAGFPAEGGPVAATSWFTWWHREGEAAPAERAVRITLATPEAGFGDSIYPVNVAYATALAAGEAGPRRRRSHLSVLWEKIKAAVGKARDALAALWEKIKAAVGKARDALAGVAMSVVGWFRTLESTAPQWWELAEPEPEPEPEPELELEAAQSLPPEPIEDVFPNPPWRPILAGIRLDYAAHDEWRAGKLALFHLQPFERPTRLPNEGEAALLPPMPQRPAFELEMERGTAGLPLSLLFRLDGTTEAAPPPIRWEAWNGTAWREVAPAKDGTDGLAVSGIITFPPSQTEIVRLRASADAGSGFARVAAVLPDALVATRLPAPGDSAPAPIPAGTVTGGRGLRGLAVVQPLPSSGGRAAEDMAALEARFPERLRHKDRAVQSWDFERLVLDRFSEVARVRAVPARRGGDPVTVAVVAVPADGEPRPLASAPLRARIEAFLAGRASPFARIEVVNAVFVEVDVAAAVRFADGEELRAEQFERELRAFLTPWSEEGWAGGADGLAGAVADFARSRSYVRELLRLSARPVGPLPAVPWAAAVAGAVSIQVVETAE